VYPIPKQVKPKLSTAISPKISIWLSPPFPDSLSGFYVNGGSQSLRRGITAYHPGSTQKYSITASGSFQQDPPPWNRWKAVLFCISYQSHEAKRKTEKSLFYRLSGQNVRYSNSACSLLFLTTFV